MERKEWWHFERFKEESFPYQDEVCNFTITSSPTLTEILLQHLRVISSCLINDKDFLKTFLGWLNQYEIYLNEEKKLTIDPKLFPSLISEDEVVELNDLILFLSKAIVSSYVYGISVLAQKIEQIIPQEKLKAILSEIPPFSEQ